MSKVYLSAEHTSLMTEDGEKIKPQISNPEHIEALKKFIKDSSVKDIVSLVSKLATAYKSKG